MTVPPPQAAAPGLAQAASRHRLLSDPTRLRVVMALSGGPSTAKILATAAGVHVNTIRAHLGRLEEAGMVTSDREEPAGRGRPRIRYRLSPDVSIPDLAGRDYRMLADVLLGLIRSALGSDAPALARKSGEAWGRHLAGPDAPRPGRELDGAGSAAYLSRLLDRLLFAPELDRGRRGWVLLLHNCPFREVAEGNQDVVCSFHLGLLDGVQQVMGGPLGAASLEPFVEPHLCRVDLPDADGHRGRKPARARAGGRTGPRGGKAGRAAG